MAAPAPDPVAVAELQRYEKTGELLPGSAQKLAGLAASAGANARFPLHVRAEAAAKVVASPIGQSFRNPDYAAEGMNNSLRRVLTRYADMLSGGMATVETLVGQWSADYIRYPMAPTPGLGGRGKATPGGFVDDAKITRTVLERLQKRENWPYLATAPALPASEERLSGILHEHFGQDLRDPATAARQWASEYARLPEHEVIRQVAKRLTVPGVAAIYTEGGQPLAGDDARLNQPAPRVERAAPTRHVPRF